MDLTRTTLRILAASAILTATLSAQTPARPRLTGQTPAAIRTERAFTAAQKAGPPELYAFLKPFPKGADLHMHLSGAVYAETFIAEAAKEGLCVAPVATGMPAVPVGHDALRLVAPQDKKPNDCAHGQATAASALTDQPLYDDLVDSFSMRGFVPTDGIDGHDQFFATFSRFSAVGDSNAGHWLNQVVTRAAAQNEQYLEIMSTPTFSHAASLGYKIGWPSGAEHSITTAQLAQIRTQLLADGLRDEVPVDVKEFSTADNTRDTLEHCSAAPQLAVYSEHTPCSVRVHWLYQVLRGFPPQQVFAQTVLAFEVASADPDVVGLNYVMAEDGYDSMHYYHLQMQMLEYLHSVYPKVHITLHAGELAPGMVPPEGLTFHIRQAIDLGHAERIGHGVDVLHENHPYALLKEMATKHIMVEINLTSNDVILGIKGRNHPLHAYMAADVPWALSTDDEGVSRITLTHEYVKGVEEQDLTYSDLKQSARTSLEHSFLHGESIWASEDNFTRRKSVCAENISANSHPNKNCAAFLNANEKAAAQYELERRIAAFEAAH